MTGQSVPVEIRVMQPSDAAQPFSSGVHALDDYFRRHAMSNAAKGISVPYVLHEVPVDAPRIVVGYFTLSFSSIAKRDLAESKGASLPNYPLPVALIGRLAVSKDRQGQGYGGLLLSKAISLVLDAAKIGGVFAIIVDVKDAPALAFYERHHFLPLSSEGWPRRCVLLTEEIRHSLAP